jgi:hypothetical protein
MGLIQRRGRRGGGSIHGSSGCWVRPLLRHRGVLPRAGPRFCLHRGVCRGVLGKDRRGRLRRGKTPTNSCTPVSETLYRTGDLAEPHLLDENPFRTRLPRTGAIRGAKLMSLLKNAFTLFSVTCSGAKDSVFVVSSPCFGPLLDHWSVRQQHF